MELSWTGQSRVGDQRSSDALELFWQLEVSQFFARLGLEFNKINAEVCLKNKHLFTFIMSCILNNSFRTFT